jgi:cytidylate kinase
MIVAIFGRSCVGKSRAAEGLAAEFLIPLRACGTEARSVASGLGISVENLTNDHHHQIDAATLEWVSKSPLCIVEGRFLDYVLAQAPGRILAIQLTAHADVRLQRACQRLERSLSMDELERIDRLDDDLTHRLYSGERLAARISFDTSNSLVEECVRQLKALMHGEWRRI